MTAESSCRITCHTYNGFKEEDTGKPSMHLEIPDLQESGTESELLPRQGGDQPYQCMTCTKTFLTSSHLALHVCMSSGTRKPERAKYKCRKYTCGRSFRHPAQLARHMAVHINDKPFKCPDCGRCFGRGSHLQTHRRLHTGEKPFKCSACSKSFTQKSGLIVHVRQHTGEKPYKCEKCGEAFRTTANLLSHQALEAGEGRHACASCNKTFKTISVLRQHEKVHRAAGTLAHRCSVCDSALVCPEELQLEPGAAKSAVLAFHCKVCNQIFTDMDEFEMHCEMHLGRYKVEEVGQEFEFEFEDEVDEEEVVEKKKSNSSDPPFRPHIATSATCRYLSEVSTRSKSRAKSKTEDAK